MICVGGLSLLLISPIKKLYGHYQNIILIADKAQLMVNEKDLELDSGMALVGEADMDLTAIRSAVMPFYGFLKAVKWLPVVGDYAGDVEPIMEYVWNTFSAIKILANVATTTVDETVLLNGKSYLLTSLIAAQPQLSLAQEFLEKADDYAAKIDTKILPESISRKIEKVMELRPLLDEILDIVELIPDAAGAETPATYLILLQNSDEIRPTGGYISSFGLLRLEKGTVTYLDFRDTSASNYISHVIEPPQPLKQILLAHYWLPRDANWSPSFPESAKQVQELYFQSTGVKTDGVIAINQYTVQQMLKITGPVQVDDQTVNSDTVLQYMIDKKVEAMDSGQIQSRKDFMTSLAKAIITKLPEINGKDRLRELAGGVLGMATAGNLFIYSNKPEIQAFLSRYGFDGDLNPGTGDYLMLVDANLGYSKADFVVRRNIEYQVDLVDLDQPTSRILISYNNPLEGNVTCQQAGDKSDYRENFLYIYPVCYWDYFRILGARGTKVENYSIPAFDDKAFIYTDPWTHALDFEAGPNGITVAGGLLILPPESSSIIEINRQLPTNIINYDDGTYTYKLNIQKQSGIVDLPVKITIVLPANFSIIEEATNIKLIKNGGKWEWEGILDEFIKQITITFK